ncbi:MAG: ABC transporter substrate-binding protein [Acaryochloridaceae cyanobacterium CSU_3_4]|nr:ABC transporter substrate-binding protein [Acaryochloridaceae cyanobacterium CSU_3_4]
MINKKFKTLNRPINPRYIRRGTALVSALLLSACQVGGNTPGTGKEEGLKIGSLLPSTGDLAPLGVPMIDTVPLVVDTVNACGGVNGKDVILNPEDDETDPTKGSQAMTNLVEVKKVSAVVGSFGSSVSQAAVDVAVRNKVLLISPGSTSTEFTARAQKGNFKNGETQYWARTAPPDTYQARALAKLAKEKGFQKVSTVAINNDYGVSFEQEFIKSFKKLGGTVLNEAKPTRYDPKGTTFDTEAAAAFANKPDAVIAILYAETGALLLKSAYEQDLMEGVQVMLTDGVKSDEFATQVGKTSDDKFILTGAIGTVPGADGNALESLTTLWKSKKKEAPPAYVPQTWDATALVLLAAQSAKSDSGDAIAAKLTEVANGPGKEVTDVCEGLKLLEKGEDINYQGASGNVDIDKNGDVLGVYDVWTVKDDGKLNVIGQVQPAE